MPDREAINEAIRNGEIWLDSQLWTVVVMVVSGYVGRALGAGKPISRRQLISDFILMVLGGLLLYFSGLMRGLDPLEMMIFGLLGGLGSVRLLQYVAQIPRLLKQLNNIK